MRLNREIGDKAAVWKPNFGEGIVPEAALAGVFKVDNLDEAQRAGIAIFWEHAFDAQVSYVRAAL